MNKRRAANRAESQRGAGESGESRSMGRGEHDYGKGHTMTRAHGSHASRGQIMGPGPVEGAGEVGGAGPGTAAERYMGLPARDGTPQPAASGETPKGESVYSEE